MTNSEDTSNSFEQQVLERFERLNSFEQGVLERFESLNSFEQEVLERLDDLKRSDDQLRQDVERFNDRFENYQKAVQWVVQLAFSLIAAATVTVIVSSVLNR